MTNRPVVIGLTPNTEKADYVKAFEVLIHLKNWIFGTAVSRVENWFCNYFQIKSAITFNAGRSGLLAILKNLNLQPGDEVMLQAFTCVAVPNSVLWADLTPIYVDVDERLNFDVSQARGKITSRTKVIIVQHTFGMSADMEGIIAFSRENNLILIEDCAHAMGARYNGKLLGTFGLAACFSFGRDKIISSVFGGVVITSDNELASKLKQYHESLPNVSKAWVLQQLLHPLICCVALYFYNTLNLGKIILFLAQTMGLLSTPIYPQEKKARQPNIFPQKYPNALASLALLQLQRLEAFNIKRISIAQKYLTNLKNVKNIKLPQVNLGDICLRFNIFVENPDKLREYTHRNKIILGSWYSHVIDPHGVDRYKLGYTHRSCPQAEKAAACSINLPTYPMLKNQQVDAVCDTLKKYVTTNLN